MKVQTIKTKEDMILFISKLSYGQNFIHKPNDYLFKSIEERLFIMNKSRNSESFRLEEITDLVLLEFHGYSSENNIYSIISTVENENLPILSEDSYNIKSFAQKAFNNKEMVFFNLDQSLYDYVKKSDFGKKANFLIVNGKPCFNGLEKQLSVYKRIEHAYYSNEESIDFDAKNTSIATVRCYTSTLSNISGKKIKCSAKDGVITVFFKEENRHSMLKRKFRHLLNEFEEDSDAIDFLTELILDIKQKNISEIEIKSPIESTFSDDDDWD